jgi:hypothetical protein
MECAFKVKHEMKDLRGLVADYLLQNEGDVSGAHYAFFDKDAAGNMVVAGKMEKTRGDKKTCKKPKLTLEQYASAIAKGSLYGGDLEIAILAITLDVSIHVYSWHFFDGKNEFRPQVFGHSDRVLSLIFDQDFQSGGRGDHYDLIIDKFPKWRKYMYSLPMWKSDYDLSETVAGRGLKAIRDFKEGDVVTFYDGHRVDERGKLVYERPRLKELFDMFGVDPFGFDFQRSHALCLGRCDVTGVVIDGYPMTLPVFDDLTEVQIGRGALANSANPTDSNMIMVWAEAPDLPSDPINNLANCEAFLIARRPIKAGEELLWNYRLREGTRVRLAASPAASAARAASPVVSAPAASPVVSAPAASPVVFCFRK